uniref:Uncharacterized protein n=1 Tax=Aegilops tauschii subsp. strangulata TaxID=200361 RepID=A0A452Z2I1_AEGTS
ISLALSNIFGIMARAMIHCILHFVFAVEDYFTIYFLPFSY